jgi:hypothetical protein
MITHSGDGKYTCDCGSYLFTHMDLEKVTNCHKNEIAASNKRIQDIMVKIDQTRDGEVVQGQDYNHLQFLLNRRDISKFPGLHNFLCDNPLVDPIDSYYTALKNSLSEEMKMIRLKEQAYMSLVHRKH